MKKSIVASVLFGALVASAPCLASGQELAHCTSENGVYTVSVQDDQGIGPARFSTVSAVVTKGTRVLASFEAEEFRHPSAVKAGRLKYQDIKTAGKAFSLLGPSKRFPNYILQVNSEKTGILVDDNMKCTVFGGKLING